MITFPPYPLPVHTPIGDGWVVYITTNGMHENDEVTVALESDGQWRHFSSADIKSARNATYGLASDYKVTIPDYTNERTVEDRLREMHSQHLEEIKGIQVKARRDPYSQPPPNDFDETIRQIRAEINSVVIACRNDIQRLKRELTESNDLKDLPF